MILRFLNRLFKRDAKPSEKFLNGQLLAEMKRKAHRKEFYRRSFEPPRLNEPTKITKKPGNYRNDQLGLH